MPIWSSEQSDQPERPDQVLVTPTSLFVIEVRSRDVASYRHFVLLDREFRIFAGMFQIYSG